MIHSTPHFYDCASATMVYDDHQVVEICSSTGGTTITTRPYRPADDIDWDIDDDTPHIVSVLTKNGARPQVKERDGC